MSVDPDPFPAEDPIPPEEPPSGLTPPPPEDNGSEQVEIRRGMRRYRKGEMDIEEGDDEDGELLVVSVRLRPAKKKAADPEESESRSKVNRFASRAAAAASVAPVKDPARGIDSAPAPTAPLMKLTPRTSQGAAGKHDWQSPFLAGKRLPLLALLFAALVVVYWVGHRLNRPAGAVRTPAGRLVTAPVPKLTTLWTPALITALDAVMAADAAGDLKTAHRLATDLRTKIPDATDLTLYLSTLQTREGKYNDAEVDTSKLLDAFAPPLQSAAVNENLGFIYARHRDLPRAVEAFADAAAADPFNPNYFQQWAEALRREGQLQEAIGRFRQALTRLPAGRSGVAVRREDIEFKMRLTQIELGKDDEVKAALDVHLKEPAPTGFWLLTAAAYSLQHGDMAAAADALQKARLVLSAEDYATLTNDYFFHAYAVRKEMAGLLPEDTPEVRTQPFMPKMGYFIDP